MLILEMRKQAKARIKACNDPSLLELGSNPNLLAPGLEFFQTGQSPQLAISEGS